jgi:hypothetical protein
MLWHGTEKNARRLAEAEASGNIGSWEAIRASYPMRLLRAREVTEEATQCFEIGFGGFLLPYKIQAAVEPYGCTLREQAAGGNDEAPRVTPGSVWRKQEGVEETREFIPSGEPPPSNYLWRDHARLAPIPHFAEIAEREGFAGNTLTPDFVQEALAPLAPFGIAVIKMPAKQHGLP